MAILYYYQSYKIDILIFGFCILGGWQIAEKAGLPLKIVHTSQGLFVREIFEEKYNNYFLPDDKILVPFPIWEKTETQSSPSNAEYFWTSFLLRDALRSEFIPPSFGG
ncbi:MAG: hypothetical protein ABIK27_04640, partial [Bacteroidota bacterium]